MPKFTEQSLENLRGKVDLIELISSFVDLKRTGASYKALCPFHDEKTPSFTISKSHTHYHCFGCGAHGDAIAFLMHYQKLSFVQAVETLADKFQVQLEYIEGKTDSNEVSKKEMRQTLLMAAQFFHFFLLQTQEGYEALRYLLKRGIHRDFLTKFSIGLAPLADQIFLKFMKAKSISENLMIQCGLLKKKSTGRIYGFFSNRIVFPIHDNLGSIIGFSARKYKEDTFGGKYINSSETLLFKKSQILFGLHYSRFRIAKEKQAIIVEGQIDALQLVYHGLNLVVAPLGTAFGEDHRKELLRLGVTKVYLAFDSDEAGIKAMCTIGNLFQEKGVEVYIVDMPKGSDPDTYLQNNTLESFLSLLETGKDWLTFIVNTYSKKVDLSSPAGKTSVAKQISELILRWESPVMVHESLKKLATLLHVPQIAFREENEISQNFSQLSIKVEKEQPINPDSILEGELIHWLLFGGDQTVLNLARNNIKVEDLRIPVCQQIYSKLLMSKIEVDLAALMEKLDVKEEQNFIEEIMRRKIKKSKNENGVRKTIQKILDRNWMQKREEIRFKIQNGNYSEDEVLDLVKEFECLKKIRPKILFS